MKFAHLADTHIRNLKYHKEYRAVFSELYTKLKKEKPDFIIHCGDIAHTKTQISPEFVSEIKLTLSFSPFPRTSNLDGTVQKLQNRVPRRGFPRRPYRLLFRERRGLTKLQNLHLSRVGEQFQIDRTVRGEGGIIVNRNLFDDLADA